MYIWKGSSEVFNVCIKIMISLSGGDISKGLENVPVCIERDVSEDSLPNFQVYSCLICMLIYYFFNITSFYLISFCVSPCVSFLYAALSLYDH